MGSHQLAACNRIMVLFLAFLVTLIPCSLGLPFPQSPEESLSPKPYSFQYGVDSAETKTSFQASESQDVKGSVGGSYTVALPDGRIQTVKYNVDPVLGYVAEVTYSGNPVYPPVKPGQLPPQAIAPYVPVGYLG